MKKLKKYVSLALIFVLFFYNIAGLGSAVLAQEATPDPSASSDPSPSAEAVSSPTSSPTTEPTPTSIPTPTPFDPNNHPPYSSPEYDQWKIEYNAWKAEQNALDDAREIREDEWEAHEKDDAWIAAHGGDYEYYVSGNWERDQEAKRLAEEAARQAASQEQSQNTTQDPFMTTTSDPFADPSQTSGDGGCSGTTAVDPFGQTLSSDTTNGDAFSSQSTDSSVSNSNCLQMTNDSTASGVSGENTQTLNDGPVDMTTGASSGDGTLVNQGNINTTSTDSLSNASASANDSLAQGSEAENLSTGEDSENLATAVNSETTTVDNSNGAYVQNNMTVEGVSGVNEVTNNDGNVELTTGDIELIANMLNILNLNITGNDFLHLIINIFGTLNGTLDLDDIAIYLGLSSDEDLEVIARNEGTGEDSTNTANAINTQDTNINNTNDAQVENNMNVTGVSGGNNVAGNDGTADVVTGRIKILANLMNFINANLSGDKWKFIMVNIFGSLTGDIILPSTDPYLNGGSGGALALNTNPGEDSINNQTAASSDTTSVTNANGVTLANNIDADGISGNNQQNGNDDEGHTTQTGGVDVVTKLMNYINFNITGNNFVLLIVNVFGKWMGKIVGFAGGGEMMAPSEGSFAALSIGNGVGGPSTIATNSNTGEGSENNANAQNTTNTDVANTNSADVTNNMNIRGISGANAVNGNDGVTNLTTGWVEINANLLNIINFNVTGRNWLVVFLNVFGDFAGNMFFGRPPAPPQAVLAEAGSNLSGTGGVEQENGNDDESEGFVQTVVVDETGTELVSYQKNAGSRLVKVVRQKSGNNFSYAEEEGKVLAYNGVTYQNEGFDNPDSFSEILLNFFQRLIIILKSLFRPR